VNPAMLLATLPGKMALYYMPSSVSGQDELKLALSLATRAGKMELSCPLGIRALSRKENLSCFGVIMVWCFLRVYGPRLRLGP